MKTINEFIEEKRLPSRWLAEYLGVSKQTLCNWKNENRFVIENDGCFIIAEHSKVIKKSDIEIK
jgi:DNA-binding XRE family transcriptional regulator